jgi:hypothetical protein
MCACVRAVFAVVESRGAERHMSSPGQTLEVCKCRLINQCASAA